MCNREVVQRKQNWTAWFFAFKDKSNQVPSLANKKWTKVINPLWSRAVKTEISRNRRAYDPFPYRSGHVQQQQPLWVLESSSPAMPKATALLLSSPSSSSCHLSSPSSAKVPEPCRGHGIDVRYVPEHSTVTYSLLFDLLWVSTLTTTHCMQKYLLSWGLRTVLWTCEYNRHDISLRLSLYNIEIKTK